jgi:cytochrome c-type biogenesis protein CcmE
MKARQRRLSQFLLASASLSLGVVFILCSLKDNLLYFVTPSELLLHPPTGKVRLGGLVKKGSVKQNAASLLFALTDGKSTVTVQYKGTIPDLFKEGQGAIVEGSFTGAVFAASTLLAKHDERYSPIQLTG